MRSRLAAALLVSSLALPGPLAEAGEGIRILIDADTANEVDDPYAIVRALVAPELEVVGLAAAQWQVSHWTTPTSMEDSHRLNQVLLGYLDRMDIPHPRGAAARLYDWGELAQHCHAAYFLIEQAHATPAGEKLTVAVLGAATNVASALLIDPTIAPRIRVYWLGTGYDHATGAWHRLDFNAINDPRALMVMLDAEELELHVMPNTVAQAMRFEMSEVRERFEGKHPLLDFLVDRWVQHVDPGRYARTIWDVALIEAILRPELATEAVVDTPPEAVAGMVWLYRGVDVVGMTGDFFGAVEGWLER